MSAEVPFSSERKWSGLTLDGHDTLVLGAPDVLASHGVALSGPLGERIAQHAANRRRVVLLAASPERLEDDRLPPGLVARGIAVLEEGLREEAVDTIAFLVREGVDIKIISGDGLATVQAVALAAGVPHAERGLLARICPTTPTRSPRWCSATTVFARVRPDQKRALVQALTRLGPLRRDGRRRRERRARTQGGASGHRDGQRQPDGEGRGRPRAADERVLDRPARDRGGKEDPAQHAPSRDASSSRRASTRRSWSRRSRSPRSPIRSSRGISRSSRRSLSGFPPSSSPLPPARGLSGARDSSATSRGSRCRSAPWSRP